MPVEWDDNFQRILRQFLDNLPPDAELTPDASLPDLGLDSLKTVQLLVELEDLYDVAIPDDRLEPDMFRTPEALWTAIAEVTATSS